MVTRHKEFPEPPSTVLGKTRLIKSFAGDWTGIHMKPKNQIWNYLSAADQKLKIHLQSNRLSSITFNADALL